MHQSKNICSQCSSSGRIARFGNMKKIEKLSFIFWATNLHELPLISHSNRNSLLVSVFRKLWLNLRCVNRIKRIDQTQGYVVCKSKILKNENMYHHTFVCNNMKILLSLYLCDGDNDCNDTWPESSDEMGCHSTREEFFQIPIKLKVFSSKVLRDWQHEEYLTQQEEAETIIQNNVGGHKIGQCSFPGQMSCDETETECYSFADVCIYLFGAEGWLLPCKYGSHLQECAAFECNQKYKCPNYYCIPFAYECDGKWDCPFGHDEGSQNQCQMERQCQLQFKCKNAQVCIPFVDICDMLPDCPHWDDEMLCDVKTSCPLICSCYLYATRCHNTSVSGINLSMLSYTFYHLSATDLSDLLIFGGNVHAKVITVSHNRIKDVCFGVSYLSSLSHFDASQNELTVIKRNCFVSLFSLQVVLLKQNGISSLEAKSFMHLNVVSLLDISNNNIYWMPSDVFENVSKICSFQITKNPLSQLEINMFQMFPVSHLFGNNFHVCCITPPEIFCPEAVPWYTSCSYLFPNQMMRILFIFMSAAVLSSNSISFSAKIREATQGQSKQVFSTFVLFINGGDLTCGLYLLVIWAADTYYSKRFVLFDSVWRGHFLCALAFVCLLGFSLLMPFLLTFLSVARLMVIIFPFHSRFKSKQFVTRCLLLGTVMVVFVTCVSVVYIRGKGAFTSSLCSPFIDPTDSSVHIKVVTLMVVTSQVSAVAIMSALYVMLVQSLRHSFHKTKFQSKRALRKSMIIQLVLVTVSNLLCWVPSSVIFLFSLFQSQHSVDLVFWATTALIPVNSVINPILFLSLNSKWHLCNKKH